MNTAKTMYVTHGMTTGAQSQTRHYKAAFLLRVLMLCVSLRTVSALGYIFREMVAICLPKCVRHMVDNLLEAASTHMPHKSRISRYRMLLDGAFMIYMRKENTRLAAQGGATRFLMCDSSMQHGTEFEGILILTIPNNKLLRGYKLANNMRKHRTPRVCCGVKR